MARLGDPGWVPDRSEAAALRDHIASFLQSEPQRADQLSRDLLRSVHGKTVASAGALAVAWRARAEALLYAGQLREAREAYEAACAFAGEAKEPGLLGQILVGRIGTLLAMGEFRATPSMARKAEVLLRRSGDQDYLRRLHINLGSGHYHRERYADACASFAEALRLMERAGQRDAVWASLQLNYGIALSQLARVDEAQRAFRESEVYGRAHGQARLVAQSIFNQGALEALRGRYRSALRQLAEAEDNFAQQDVRELLAASHLEQAQIYLDLFMPAEGRDLARRAAASFQAEGMLLDAELAHLAEARSLLLLERPVEAIRLLAEAEEFYRARRIPARRARILLHLAQARLAQGEMEAAVKSVGNALHLAERLDLDTLTSACRCLRAEMFLRGHDPAGAERSLRGVTSILPRLPMGDRLEYWSTAARVARAAGKTALAARRYRHAARCLEAQRALIPGLELRARSFERSVRVYHDRIDLLASAPGVRIDQVLPLMERARGRTFRELLASRGRKSHQEIVGKRAVLGSIVRRLDTILMGGQAADDRETGQLRRQMLSLEREITARVRRLEATQGLAGGNSSLRRSAQLVPLLAPGELLIEYFVTEERILAAVVSRERRFLRSLGISPVTLVRQLDHLRLQLDSFAATASRPLGSQAFLQRGTESRLRELHDALLLPLLREVPSIGRLTIVPHGILHQVPFECLHDGTGYIDRSLEVARCPTADFLIERRRRSRRSPARRCVAIAGTRPGSPFIEEEARGVIRSWGTAAGELLLDPSPAHALETMKEARLIHVSAHGNFREDNPLFSSLHVGPEVLFLADILETRLAADLVVLSACNSGQTFSGRGDALMGVAHAFLVAGAQRLVASLWRVHDQATAEWMEVFHRAYGKGPDAVAARRTASQAVREKWPHPFYWGGFCALGG